MPFLHLPSVSLKQSASWIWQHLQIDCTNGGSPLLTPTQSHHYHIYIPPNNHFNSFHSSKMCIFSYLLIFYFISHFFKYFQSIFIFFIVRLIEKFTLYVISEFIGIWHDLCLINFEIQTNCHNCLYLQFVLMN